MSVQNYCAMATYCITNVHSSTEMLALLLAYGADPDISSSSGSTAAHEAAYRGELEFLKLLAAGGANLRAVCVEGMTPLEYARRAGQEATAQWLQVTLCKHFLPSTPYRMCFTFHRVCILQIFKIR